MNHIAEYVSPGHPDRLADAAVDRCVALAVGRDADALVGLECAVYRDKVFLTGRIAAGRGQTCAVTKDELVAEVREAYREAGYGERWKPSPEELKVTVDVCLHPLYDSERAIRDLSDDQNVVTGYACGDERTDYLPPAHYIARELGRKVEAWRRANAAETLGPDFKILADLEDVPNGGLKWNRLTLSIWHIEGTSGQKLYALLFPVLEKALEEIAVAPKLEAEKLFLNGAGDFTLGGPEGDNGLSGKKPCLDFYGPGVPIGGGAIHGKDPHKVDVRGAKMAREMALRLKKETGAYAALVRLAWSPGEAEPSSRRAWTIDALGCRMEADVSR